MAKSMAKKSRLTTTLSGISGEYFVAAELSRRGYVASLTLGNTRGIDILASDVDAKKSVGIQVKTNQRARKEWLLNKKVEDEEASNLVFVFVCLNGLGLAECHVVPRSVVSDFSRENHRRWLTTPGRNGRKRNDTPMRKFADPDNQYLNKWELLGLGPSTF